MINTAEIRPKKIVKIGGMPEGYEARYLAKFITDKKSPIIFICRNEKRLLHVKRALMFFAPEIPIFEFPAWDCLPYDRLSPNANISARRMATLAALQSGFNTPFILLTTISAVSQYVPSRVILSRSSFTATVGHNLNETALRQYFTQMGFVQTSTVMEPGDYAIRGGLIDIYAPGDIGPIRLDLFGDVLDNARRFDPVTQRTIEKLERIELAPVSEIVLDTASIKRFRAKYRAEFGAAGTDDPFYESVSAGRKYQGVEHWSPYFHETMETLFDYVENAPVFIDEGVLQEHTKRMKNILGQYEARMNALQSKSRLDTVYKPCAPNLLYLDEETLKARLALHEQRYFGVIPIGTGPNIIDAGARIGRNFSPERNDETSNLFKSLADHINLKRKNKNIIIASFSEGARERLSGLLNDQEVSGASKISRFSDITTDKGSLSLVVWPLEEGFETKDLVVISEQDVLGERMMRSKKRKRKAENFLTEATSLSVGDLVVHIDHGIGRFSGLETVTAAGAPHDCLQIEYANNDRLYLPVENIDLLSRYGQETSPLDRLGGGAWQAKKAKLKVRIRDMADKLIKIAAERTLRKAEIMEAPEELWDRFCAKFPYTETDDQLNAIEDVLEDMSSGRPMDRLICGDVGFGKTEVALRAAFVAAISGTQVVLVAPTTLLARQHVKTFEERFRGTGLRVRQLSRFISTKEAKITKEGLRDGSVEIVIGTHALLAKDIKFANLGLMIIDEEQKFGVIHKERLKQIRADVHVLTLTATPIPRTLQMSLSGVRELSIIATPPVDRLPIHTYISEFDGVTIREALLREYYRGGQSFYVVPRLSDLVVVEDFLKDQVPEITYGIAHGKMLASELDDRMTAFYDGKYGILLATTIVESGLDIPTANTMIIHRADMFGLAQLYQIRGRVGRSKTRAYAYLTTNPRKPLTDSARKRLRVLGSLDNLGAGFTLASQDLDIRGAGNLLGEEQSGNVREVGYELYQEMLEEEISKMKTGGLQGVSGDTTSWSPQINLGVPVLIPANYVPDLDIRLGLYRRLSNLAKKVEMEDFAAELIDRFGSLPSEVETLLRVVRIKGMCRMAGISKLDGGAKGAVIQFYKNKFINPAGLAEYMADQRGSAKVRDNKIVIRRDWISDNQKVKGAFIIARDFAVLAKVVK